MDWQFTLARSLGKALDAEPHPQRSSDNNDKMTEMGRQRDFCHSVISVIKGGGAKSAESPPAREAFSWPPDVQRRMAAAMAGFEAQGHPYLVAEALAFHQVKVQLDQAGGLPPAQEPVLDMSDWPPEAMAEVQAMSARLIAGGWGLSQARAVAQAIVSDRWEQTIN